MRGQADKKIDNRYKDIFRSILSNPYSQGRFSKMLLPACTGSSLPAPCVFLLTAVVPTLVLHYRQLYIACTGLWFNSAVSTLNHQRVNNAISLFSAEVEQFNTFELSAGVCQLGRSRSTELTLSSQEERHRAKR